MHSTNPDQLKIDGYANALREQDTLDCVGGSPIAAQAAADEGTYWLQTKNGLHVLFTRLEPHEDFVHLVGPRLLNEPAWLAHGGFSLDTSAGLDIRSSEIAAFGKGRG